MTEKKIPSPKNLRTAKAKKFGLKPRKKDGKIALRPRGPKTALTDELISRFTTQVAKGLSFRRASDLIGKSDRLTRTWREEGERCHLALEEAASDDLSSLSEYQIQCLKFWRACVVSDARNQEYHITNVNKAGDADWRASAWMLTHRYPDEFGDLTKLAGPDGKPLPEGRIVVVIPDNGRGDLSAETPTATESESPIAPPPPAPIVVVKLPDNQTGA